MSYENIRKPNPAGKPARGAAATDERRSGNRHMFTAAAEVVELGSGARFSTRTTDLGPGGCFVDTMVPFPVGSKVRASVRKGKMQFEADGTVVYSQVGLGMGICFETLDPSQREALDGWLAELMAERQGSQQENERPAQAATTTEAPGNQAALVRLVRLLITKGLLTEAEGSSVLYEPVL